MAYGTTSPLSNSKVSRSIMITLTLLCTDLSVQVTESHSASLDGKQQIPRGPLTQSVNPVVHLQICVLPYLILERLQDEGVHFRNAQVI